MRFGKGIALVVGMDCCRSGRWLWMEWNRVAQVALCIVLCEEGRRAQASIFAADFKLSSSDENRSYGSRNEQVAQNETF